MNSLQWSLVVVHFKSIHLEVNQLKRSLVCKWLLPPWFLTTIFARYKYFKNTNISNFKFSLRFNFIWWLLAVSWFISLLKTTNFEKIIISVVYFKVSNFSTVWIARFSKLYFKSDFLKEKWVETKNRKYVCRKKFEREISLS